MKTISDPEPNTQYGTYQSERYAGMTYVCEKCGREEQFDGVPVRIRTCNPPGDQSCYGNMELQNAEAYWNGDESPEEVIIHA